MKITKIEVINQDSASNFAAALRKVAAQFQAEDLLVVINNPHLVNNGADYTYVAVVEGHK